MSSIFQELDKRTDDKMTDDKMMTVPIVDELQEGCTRNQTARPFSTTNNLPFEDGVDNTSPPTLHLFVQ